MRRTVLLLTLASTLMLTGCLTTSTVVIDAGCQAYQQNAIRPSPADTARTARGLYVLNEAMIGACPEMNPASRSPGLAAN